MAELPKGFVHRPIVDAAKKVNGASTLEAHAPVAVNLPMPPTKTSGVKRRGRPVAYEGVNTRVQLTIGLPRWMYSITMQVAKELGISASSFVASCIIDRLVTMGRVPPGVDIKDWAKR